MGKTIAELRLHVERKLVEVQALMRDLKKTASQIYTTPVHLPEMEALELAAIAPPAESPPLPVALAPVGALQSCHGGTITDLVAYYK